MVIIDYLEVQNITGHSFFLLLWKIQYNITVMVL